MVWPSEPSVAISSSWTILTTIWPGVTDLTTVAPTACSRTRSVKLRTTSSETSASSSARRTSRIAASTSASDSEPRPVSRSRMPPSFSDRLSNKAVVLSSKHVCARGRTALSGVDLRPPGPVGGSKRNSFRESGRLKAPRASKVKETCRSGPCSRLLERRSLAEICLFRANSGMKITRRRLLGFFAGLGVAIGVPSVWLSRMKTYSGPVSDHFDGERFFDPDGVPPKSFGDLIRWQFGRRRQRAAWPEWAPSPQADIPPLRVDGDKVRLSFVGHASWLIQTAGLNILVDPVWSARVSPFSFAGPKRRND